MYRRPTQGKCKSTARPPVWSGHVFGLLMRPPTDRWPRWVTRIGLQALRRALRRDDERECPSARRSRAELCAVAVCVACSAGRAPARGTRRLRVNRLDRNESHRRPTDRLADALGVTRIVLVAADERIRLAAPHAPARLTPAPRDGPCRKPRSPPPRAAAGRNRRFLLPTLLRQLDPCQRLPDPDHESIVLVT
jgi:hypothetical protein